MARSDDLPSSVEALQQLVLSQQATIDEKSERISWLEEWKRLIQSHRFASRSEKVTPEQGHLFNETEVEASAAEADASDALDVPAHKCRKAGRRPLPDFLPVEERVHDLSEDEKVCSNDASHALVEIGRETSEQLNFIPARGEIVRHIRPKYACPHCKEGAKIAPMPKLPVPKSIATPSLLAHVATSKYVDALPLYRQEKIFQRLGVDVSRATLASWRVKRGDLLEPLMERIRAEVRAYDVV